MPRRHSMERSRGNIGRPWPIARKVVVRTTDPHGSHIAKQRACRRRLRHVERCRRRIRGSSSLQERDRPQPLVKDKGHKVERRHRRCREKQCETKHGYARDVAPRVSHTYAAKTRARAPCRQRYGNVAVTDPVDWSMMVPNGRRSAYASNCPFDVRAMS